MRYNPIPKKGDRAINFDGWSNVNRQAIKLNNIQFDPTIFVVQDDPSGMYISMNPQSVTTTASNASGYHLSGEVTQSNCAGAGGVIIVHGGIACRKTNSNVYAVPLTCDSAPSEFYEDYKTISGITTSKYVYAEFDDPLKPTTLTIGTNATYPVDDANLYTKFVLGLANVSGGVLTWEPYREMDLIPDAPIIPDTNMPAPDFRSLEFREGDGRLQLLGMNNSSSTTVVGVQGTGITFRATNVAPQTCGIGPNDAGVMVEISGAGHIHHIGDSDHATNADHATYADTAGNCVSATVHHTLTDLVGGTGLDDHSGTNYNYIGNTGDYARNKMSNGLGDWAEVASVAVNDRHLCDSAGATVLDWEEGRTFEGGRVSVDWLNRKLYGAVSTQLKIDWENFELWDVTQATLNWLNRTLDYDFWTVTVDDNVVDEDPDSGGFRCAGGVTINKTVQADRYQLLDDKDCYFSSNAFSAVVTDNIILNSPVITYGNTASTGITLTNWAKVGGLIGGGIVAQTIYANTGSSVVQMEVLARIA